MHSEWLNVAGTCAAIGIIGLVAGVIRSTVRTYGPKMWAAFMGEVPAIQPRNEDQ